MADNLKAIVNIPAWARELANEGDKVNGSAMAYRSVPLIYRAVRLRADALSSVPVIVRQGQTEKEWPFMTPADDLLWKIETSLLLTGSAFLEIARNTVKTKDLVFINPYTMTVDYDNGLYKFTQQASGSKAQTWVNDPGKNKYEIAYIRDYNPTDDIHAGVSPSQVALTDAQLMRYMSRFGAKFFEGGAMPITLLGVDSEVSQEERDRIQGFFKRAATGIANAFKVLALRGEIKPQVISQPLDDLAIPELYAQAKQNICNAFGIPQTMLDDAANYATAESHNAQFWQTTVRPRGRMVEGALNRQVFKQMGLEFELSFDELDVFQEDEHERSGSLLTLVNAGVPLLVAMDILGYDLSDEQRIELEKSREEVPEKEVPGDVEQDMRRWEKFAINGVGKKRREFDTKFIPPAIRAAIQGALDSAHTVDDIKLIFGDVRKHVNTWSTY